MALAHTDLRRTRNEASAFAAGIRFEILAAAVREDICLAKARLTRLRFARAIDELERDIQGRAYNPDQPRVPAGNPHGGQWTSTLGGALTANPGDETDLPQALPIEVAAEGHHFVPRVLFEKEPFSPETRRVFQEAKTGPLLGGPHHFDGPHRIYSRAVAERYQEFLRERGLRSEDLTPSHARQFADSIRNSTDPRIRDFNLFIYKREVWYRIRRLRLRE